MENLERNTFCAVAALHLAILVSLFFKMDRNSEAPVLSFSVTMMDVASNPGNVSTASTLSSKNNKEKIEKSDTQKTAKSEENLNEKTKNNSANSIQQNAVFAKDAKADFSAAYLQNPTPPYPALSRRLGEQGKVILNVYVNKDGKAETVVIAKSSGFSRLDESAQNTVKNWRFAAAKKGDQLTPSWVQVPINFILDSNGK